MQNLKSKFEIIGFKTFYFLLVFLSFALLGGQAFLFLNLGKAEASALSLSIEPPIITINAIPPTTVTSPFSIQNKSDVQITLQIQLKPFKAKGENGELEYSKEASQILKNIQILDDNVPVERVTLEPMQQKSLNLNISVLQDTTISDYYFSIIFISTGSPQIESSSSINQIGIATNVLLSVGPLETPTASIEEFSSKLFFEKGPVPFNIRIKNAGNHLVKPKGEVVIKNMFGQSIGKLSLTNVNILSDSTRAIPNDAYMQELRLKDNKKTSPDFSHPIALWKESFLLGLYTATLDISMSDEGPAFTRTIHFFAFPLQGIIIIIIIAIAIIVFRNRLKLYMKKDRT